MQPSCSRLPVISRRNMRMTSNHHAPNALSDTRCNGIFENNYKKCYGLVFIFLLKALFHLRQIFFYIK